MDVNQCRTGTPLGSGLLHRSHAGECRKGGVLIGADLDPNLSAISRRQTSLLQPFSGGVPVRRLFTIRPHKPAVSAVVMTVPQSQT